MLRKIKKSFRSLDQPTCAEETNMSFLSRIYAAYYCILCFIILRIWDVSFNNNDAFVPLVCIVVDILKASLLRLQPATTMLSSLFLK